MDRLQLHAEQSNHWSKNNVCQGTKSFCSDLVQWAETLASKHLLILDNCDGVLARFRKAVIIDNLRRSML